jgi:hypothetical protein
LFYDQKSVELGDMANTVWEDKPDKEQEVWRLSNKHLNDIRDTAEQLQIVLKEKYLGRLPGQKRGESGAKYAGQITFLSSALGVAMIGFLGYTSYQLKVTEKNKVF